MKTLFALIPVALAALASVSCAANPGVTAGANPHDMTVAQHRAAADREERTAESLEARYDPNATKSESFCRSGPSDADICWDTTTNPTDKYKEQADVHRLRARDHQNAALYLLESEREHCEGVPTSARVASPLSDQSVASVRVITGEGAAFKLRKDASVDLSRLEQLLACYRARVAAAGYSDADAKECSIAIEKADSEIVDGDDGPVLTMTAEDPDVAHAIIACAEEHDTSQAPNAP